MRFFGGLWLLLCLPFPPRALGETFYGPTSATNKLLIASNEIAIITSVLSAATLNCDVAISNTLYTAHLNPMGAGRLAIAGPSELKVSSACAIYF